jgi:hypothetical protein
MQQDLLVMISAELASTPPTEGTVRLQLTRQRVEAAGKITMLTTELEVGGYYSRPAGGGGGGGAGAGWSAGGSVDDGE